MSVAERKRITFKRTRPNPLFQEWLEELLEEAKRKGSNVETMLTEALHSLSKYPLPLQSGAECAILKGFDKRLCMFLDKRLEVHKCDVNEVIPTVDLTLPLSTTPVALSTTPVSISPTSGTLTPPSVILTNPASISPTASEGRHDPVETIPISLSPENREVNSCLPSISPKNKRRNTVYKPLFRSGGYALLMGLLEISEGIDQLVNKEELINIAQKYSEESFTRPKPDTYYTAWSNMSRLIKKGLVSKTGGRKVVYSLTESGLQIACELQKDTIDRPTMNDMIFDNTQRCLSSTQAKEVQIVDVEESRSVSSKENFINLDRVESIPFVQSYDTQTVSISTEIIEMDIGSFDIILIIDKHETSGSKKNDPTVAQFNKYPDLKHEYRSLKVGDFTWVARHKCNPTQELVLPYIVERKRMDDLGSSIKDGRFHEQKFRLRRCGLNNVIYMVENFGSNKHVGLPVQSLMQSLANTRVQDGFKVQITDSLTHSAKFLAIMTNRLFYEYKDRRLRGHNKEATDGLLMTFDFFNKSSLKNKPLSVTGTFIKMLLQLKGVSVEKALAITNKYKTPKLLMTAYASCNERDGELLLANLKNEASNRNVGPTVSKLLYQLFTSRDLC